MLVKTLVELGALPKNELDRQWPELHLKKSVSDESRSKKISCAEKCFWPKRKG